MIASPKKRVEFTFIAMFVASVILALLLLTTGLRILDLSMPGPARTLRSVPERWSMRLAAGTLWLAAQAVLIGALPLLWRRRSLHLTALKVIGVVVVLSSVASLSLALVD